MASISRSVWLIWVCSSWAFFLLSSNSSSHSNSSFLVSGAPPAFLMALFSSFIKSEKSNSCQFSSLRVSFISRVPEI
ncbi:hypothetical protein [Mariniflexile fucanivorans]|uniref:hypothetical protein n=1 Tax=Mariniflexile fucanivorans TaxID=264023 RepID=UPI0014042709|nr:hypothetical protein [Mariniflexile fucanivorans]